MGKSDINTDLVLGSASSAHYEGGINVWESFVVTLIKMWQVSGRATLTVCLLVGVLLSVIDQGESPKFQHYIQLYC